MTAILGLFCAKWRVCSWWVELYEYRAHFGASNAAPRRSPATFTLSWTPLVHTTLSPHPLGSLELAVGPYHHHVHQGYGVREVSLARPDGHFYGQGAQQPLTPGLSGVGPGQPIHLTVCRPQKQDPGSSLGLALHPLGRGDRKKKHNSKFWLVFPRIDKRSLIYSWCFWPCVSCNWLLHPAQTAQTLFT